MRLLHTARMTSLHTCTSAIHPEKVIHALFLSFKCNPHPRVRLNLGCLSPKNSHVDDSVLNHLRQNVLHAHCAIYSQCVCCACLRFIGRIYMQPVMYSCFCSFSSYYCCRYLHCGRPSKMFTLHHAERNFNDCDTFQ